jgi:hypothetical protein
MCNSLAKVLPLINYDLWIGQSLFVTPGTPSKTFGADVFLVRRVVGVARIYAFDLAASTLKAAMRALSHFLLANSAVLNHFIRTNHDCLRPKKVEIIKRGRVLEMGEGNGF